MKACSKCKSSWPLSHFRLSSQVKDGYTYWCKTCLNSRDKKWRDAQGSGYQWSNMLRHRYGIDAQTYNQMLTSQDGKCKICQKTDNGGRRLSVDHDHNCCPGKKSCGKCIRFLLCNPCNYMVGYLERNPDLIFAVARYAGIDC